MESQLHRTEQEKIIDDNQPSYVLQDVGSR